MNIFKRIVFYFAKKKAAKFVSYLYSKETYDHLKYMSKKQLIRIIINQQLDIKKLMEAGKYGSKLKEK